MREDSLAVKFLTVHLKFTLCFVGCLKPSRRLGLVIPGPSAESLLTLGLLTFLSSSHLQFILKLKNLPSIIPAQAPLSKQTLPALALHPPNARHRTILIFCMTPLLQALFF
jgi:hypothetical protein